jgi:hypothetical protein
LRNHLRRCLPLFLLAAACLYTYKLEVPETHTYAAPGITSLNAKTQNGWIHVTASHDNTVIVDSVVKHAYGRDQADAEQALANVTYHDTIVGNELRVEAEMPGGSRPYGASFTFTTPDSIDLSLSTTNGDVSVANTAGDISVSTTNGNVELTGTTGTASVSTTNGRLAVKVHSGELYGATTNAAVECDLAALGPFEDVTLSTTNGKVTLWLPDDLSAVLDATNSNGIITVYDFTVTYETQTEHHVRGRIGSGASSITITTTNGDVVVRQR